MAGRPVAGRPVGRRGKGGEGGDPGKEQEGRLQAALLSLGSLRSVPQERSREFHLPLGPAQSGV